MARVGVKKTLYLLNFPQTSRGKFSWWLRQVQMADQQCMLSNVPNLHNYFHFLLKYNQVRMDCYLKSWNTVTCSKDNLQKGTYLMCGRQAQLWWGPWEPVDSLHPPYFAFPPALWMPYKQAAVHFQFSLSGHKLQRLQSKSYPFNCLCHRNGDLLLRGRLDKREKQLLLLLQLNPALNMNQCAEPLLTSGLRYPAVYQRKKIKANKEVMCPKGFTVCNDGRKKQLINSCSGKMTQQLLELDFLMAELGLKE